MNPINIHALHDNVKVLARFATKDAECGSRPEWSEPMVVNLFVSRAIKDYKSHREGSIIELTVRDFNWATYQEKDFNQEHNEFLIENYRMQILSIER